MMEKHNLVTEEGKWYALTVYVRGVIDEAVKDGENEFPVMGEVLVKAGIVTRPILDELEKQGHVKSVTVEVPSVLVPSKTVPAKAYYTERLVPTLCQSAVEPTDKAKLDLLT